MPNNNKQNKCECKRPVIESNMYPPYCRNCKKPVEPFSTPNKQEEEYKYIPKEVDNVCCPICGISTFSHSHPKNSKPKDFIVPNDATRHSIAPDPQKELRAEFYEKFDQYAFEFPRIRAEVADFFLAKMSAQESALRKEIEKLEKEEDWRKIPIGYSGGEKVSLANNNSIYNQAIYDVLSIINSKEK